MHNPRTGEHIEILSEADEVVTMVATWVRTGQRAPEHIHPHMEERWEVLEGRAAFRIDGVEVEGGPGTVVVAPPGRRHLAWNPSSEVTRVQIQMRPPLRWAEFTRRLFAGEDTRVLLREYADEVVLPES